MRTLTEPNRRTEVGAALFPARRARLSRKSRFRIAFLGILVLLAASVFLKNAYQGELDQVEDWFEFQAQSMANRHPFMLTRIKVKSSFSELEGAIRAAADIDLPVSVLDIDLEAVRNRIASLDGIVDAKVSVTDEGELEISVEERTPVSVWRNGRRLELVDSYGGRVGSISSRAERIDLGLIAGEGAKNAVVESLEIFRVAKPLENEIRGLVRIGKRRWNLELEGGRKILLPEQGAVEAMEKLIVWDAAEQVFQKDFEYFDLRIAERPTVRLREPKPGEI